MSVLAATGFVAAGGACGIKASGQADLAVVATADGMPVAAAGVFTANLAPAAPVQVSRDHLRATAGRAAAVVINSGNANAATGASGRSVAERMCALTAEAVGCGPEHVLVCSTGLIGIPLAPAALETGIPLVAGGRGATPASGAAAAAAILTTDTHSKEVVVRSPEGWTVGGMAKGAAMLAPNMATMLAVLTTDADVTATELQEALGAGVAGSFNAMSVDGCTSTNDTVLILASARAGRPDPAQFQEAVAAACSDLAGQMVGDAEGATKVVTVRVVGARDDGEARRAARKVAESQLVKCSLYGGDPYWGRVVSELGTAGVAFNPDRVEISYGGIPVCQDGVAVVHDEAALAAYMSGREIEIRCDLHLGGGAGVILTNDLSPGYIDENMRTS